MSTPVTGAIRCRTAQIGEQCRIGSDGVATFPIGQPTFTSNEQYPQLGKTAYTTDSGVGITNSTTPSEGFCLLDSWLNTYLLDSPPTLIPNNVTTTSQYIEISWSNPVQKKLAFMSAYVPQITKIHADIVLSDENEDHMWSSTNTSTIIVEEVQTKPSITSLRLTVDDADDFKRIIQGSKYDIRIYAVNEAVISGGKTPKYITYINQATGFSGPPDKPLGVSATEIGEKDFTVTWSKPQITDLSFPSSTIPIQDYIVSLRELSTVQYGMYHTMQIQEVTTTSTHYTFSNLSPGTTYEVTVKARNPFNLTYGEVSTPIQAVTLCPMPPPWASPTITPTIENVERIRTGYTLDGGELCTNIVQFNDLLQDPLRITVQSVRTNYQAGDQSSVVGTIDALTDTDVATVVTTGFGYTDGAKSVTSTKVQCTTDGERDFAEESDETGFWRVTSVSAEIVGVPQHYRERQAPYTLSMKFNPLYFEMIQPPPVLFYVDDLQSVPDVTCASITRVDNLLYITGQPIVGPDTLLSFQCTLSNLFCRYLRQDLKHCTVTLISSAGIPVSNPLVVGHGEIITSNDHKYFLAPDEDTPFVISEVPLGVDGRSLMIEDSRSNIQFNTFNLQIDPSNMTVDDNIGIQITPFNLIGQGDVYQNYGLIDSNGNVNASLKIDPLSITEVLMYNGSINGLIMESGIGDFPDVETISTPLDHTIINNTQLVLHRGLWQTQDISEVCYLSLKYNQISNQEYSKIHIRFKATGLQVDPDYGTSNFKCFVKIPGCSSWLSCTSPVESMGVSISSPDGTPCLVSATTSSGFTTLCVDVPPDIDPSADIYVRFGLLGVEQCISCISIQCV